MKGIIFTEFLEMVESNFGLETVDHIIEKSDLKSEGAYTSVGTYDFEEMVSLLTHLSEKVNIPVDTLVYEYGKYFFTVLTKAHPEIFKQYDSPLELLNSVENHIHVHVRKIYPNAELPSFDVVSEDDNGMVMIYRSERALYRLAHGLIEKTFEHYRGKANIAYKKLNENGTEVKFVIEKVV